MNTRLFIENEEIELDESVQFAITRCFEDLSDPTSIINDWSKTVDIPGTIHNNVVFGHFYNPNTALAHQTTFSPVGIHFDPSRKLQFRLMYGETILMLGYAKVTSVSYLDQKATYHLTLNGELGRIFQELSKITFQKPTVVDPLNPTPEEQEAMLYYIDGNNYFTCDINKATMKNFFEYPSRPDPTKALANCNEFDIIGFTPNNAFMDDFDYKTFQLDATGSKSFQKTLEDTSWFAGLRVNPDTVYPDGIKPREIGEYRVNHQLPYIFIHRLWDIFVAKAQTLPALSGYSFRIDPSTWTTSSKYWSDFVMLLDPIVKSSNEKTYNNSYNFVTNAPITWYGNQTHVQTNIKSTNNYVEEKTCYNTTTQKFGIDANFEYVGNQKLLHNIFCSKAGEVLHDGTIHIHPQNGFTITTYMVDANGTMIPNSRVRTFVRDKVFNLSHQPSTYDVEVILDGFELDPDDPQEDRLFASFEIPIAFDYTQVDTGANFQIKYEVTWRSLDNPPLIERTSGGSYNRTPEGQWGLQFASPYTISVLEKSKRSGGKFTLNDLWNNAFSPFDRILQYFKLFHMYMYVDQNNKVVEIVKSPIYFARKSNTYKDWTDKLDTSREMVITPVYWGNKYVDFSYEEAKTEIGEKFYKEQGHQWGARRIITDYNFNEEREELFPKLRQPLTSSDTILSWEMVWGQHLIQYTMMAEEMVCNKDEDGKAVDTFGTFYLYYGNTMFDTNPLLYPRQTYVSDDTSLQKAQGLYFYTQMHSQDMAIVTSYQRLGLRYRWDAATFGVPEKMYLHPSLSNFSWTPRTGPVVWQTVSYVRPIYSNFWHKWIEERYNIKTKLVTCYLNLTPLDYFNFEFNDFIKIDNQLYVVNKIYDYDVNSGTPTKVDLISVNNISAYTTDNYVYVELKTTHTTMSRTSEVSNRVYANYDWTILGNGFDFIDESGVTHHNEMTGFGNKDFKVIPTTAPAGENTIQVRLTNLTDVRKDWVVTLTE